MKPPKKYPYKKRGTMKHKALSDATLKGAMGKAKPYRLHDGDGLFAQVSPRGVVSWWVKYRREGKDTRQGLGRYPAVTLLEARRKAEELRIWVAQGKDPKALQRAQEEAEEVARITLGEACESFLERKRPSWRANTTDGAVRCIRLLRDLNKMELVKITPEHLVGVFERINAPSMKRRLHSLLVGILNDAVDRELIPGNPALRGKVKAVVPHGSSRTVEHRAALLVEGRFGELLLSIRNYPSATTRLAMEFLALTALRTSEVLGLRWSWYDRPTGSLVIPALRMKMKTPHVVPLSRQAISLLDDAHALSGWGELVFPGRTIDKPMARATMRMALRIMGFKEEETCIHGLRGTFASMATASGLWSRDAVELALAHAERQAVRAAYQHSDLLPERARLLQWWADRCDAMRNEADGRARGGA